MHACDVDVCKCVRAHVVCVKPFECCLGFVIGNVCYGCVCVFVCLCAVITKMCYDRTVKRHPQNGEKTPTER